MDSALNNLQRLICHKTQTPKPTKLKMIYMLLNQTKPKIKW